MTCLESVLEQADYLCKQQGDGYLLVTREPVPNAVRTVMSIHYVASCAMCGLTSRKFDALFSAEKWGVSHLRDMLNGRDCPEILITCHRTETAGKVVR